MAFTRLNRYLLCFYCGRKSSIRFGGQQSFECLSCDATNYLDEKGEITDPPASAIAENAPSKVTYAVARPVSPSSKPSGNIFCETCLLNQRLFTASIAQYLPEDPDAPDYAARESQYSDFRKRLEKIYPQICAECEPRVRQRIEQSAYTAKTDVLRRMIDQSKINKIITQRSWLDVFHLLGRWLWALAFTLEIISHILGMSLSGLWYCTARESAPWICSLFQSVASELPNSLPEQARFLRWSFYASLSSCWWNPLFVLTVRGFTKHVLGLPSWYIYQLMVLGIRLFSMRFLRDTDSRTMTTGTMFSAHLLGIIFALILFRLAATCIRWCPTPLFGAKSKIQLRRPDSPQKKSTPQTPDGVKNMSDLLDEILESPSLSRAGAPPGSQQPPPQRSLAPSPQTNDDGVEEMDWSPSATSKSQHRAFSSYRDPGPANSGFSQAPTEAKKGAFWYHVPPAPVSPAARLFNPPNQPRLRNINVDSTSPTSPTKTVSFRHTPVGTDGRVNVGGAGGGADRQPPVAFARPSFFPPPPENDPRNGLAEVFEESFSLRQGPEEQQRRGWMGGLFGARK
ncbi:hypothetical protein CONLIGDRAFT_415399 [Coniochaeta ligniaria NRRL 30616]|uniref:Ima1 N-terminal domain-containing protein n=1 Tax=Coniochaeta ligniaria NRRL 30616 TaxID=1408157 RepID=A0A1J7IHE4_9PEZI|nr:hypothetical protein CONLIGDRAFT_415399 [Coniochaeta ligniaria NRRL 30616]